MNTTLRVLIGFVVIALAACGPSGSGTPDSGGLHTDAPPYMPDAFGGPNFGQLCTTSDDCGPGGYCVSSQNGNICTYGCDQGCPDYYHCRATDIAGSLVSLCLPLRFDFCKPCSSDAACDGGICVNLDDGAGFCLPPCPFEGTCPMGYSCGTDPTNMHQGSYCVPNTGSCTCNAMNDGSIRSCENTNAVGTCYGLETCDANAGGWTACTATTATTEVCDGMDNDCDQLIDDGVSGSACPIDVPNVGTCTGVALCTGSGLTCQGQTPTAEKCNFGDDDCDGKTDETWPEVYPTAQTCNAGVGGCERFGVYRCNSTGTGVECSVTAGTPTSELCNGLDDDCDTNIDENFKSTFSPPPANPLGASCTVGTGACARTGNYVCAQNGAGTTCSVTPGNPAAAETCNGLDDNCNNQIDEGFKNQGTGQYDQNTACGSCAVDCTQLLNLPNATGVCSTASGTPQCQMQCMPNAFDLDNATSDGCELVLDPQAIYVSTDDVNGADDATCGLGPYNTGAGNHPCLTIAQGIVRAGQTGRTKIRVANGIYDETVTIPNGVSFLGGHRPDNWQRNVSGTGTMITGVGTIASTNHDYTVRALNITSATIFEGFLVVGSVNAKTAGNSYAIYVSGSNANLQIINNIVFGGRGGPGTVGGSGNDGTTGPDATGRNPNLGTSDAAYDAHDATGTGQCATSNNRQLTNGGANTCNGDDVSGGNGGGNTCPASAQAICTTQGANFTCNFVTATSINGFAGQAGAGAGGGAGGGGAARGDDMIQRKQIGNSDVCYIPNGNTYGANGANGANGSNGTAGAGCTAATGSVVSGHWVGGSGANGAAGANGGGGGGGGAGGGSHCDTCTSGKDTLGGHGGGGGAGGCGGGGGGAASAGGGAFAIFITGTTASIVTGNTLHRGEGGVGGVGGPGGKSGSGGSGALGGTTGVPATFCTDTAGRGGNGGNGGYGAGGGGGCGGASFGIFTSGLGTPNYCSTASPPNTISDGTGGAGGAGGYSVINQGTAGSAGTLGTCQFN